MLRSLVLLQTGRQLAMSVRFAARASKTRRAKSPQNRQISEKDIRYNPWQAIRLMKAYSHSSFDETVDLCVHLNVNPKIGDQLVRGSAVLPAGTGTKVVVAVLCPEGYEEDAKNAGADIVDSAQILEQVTRASNLD